MPSNISKARLHKAFNEGRRSARETSAENPYDNPKLRQLWAQARAQEQSGALTLPIPPLEHGETRAQRAPQNPPRPKRPGRPHGQPQSRSGPRRRSSGY